MNWGKEGSPTLKAVLLPVPQQRASPGLENPGASGKPRGLSWARWGAAVTSLGLRRQLALPFTNRPLGAQMI